MKWMNTQLVGASSPYHIMSLDNESLLDPVYDPLGEHQHFYVCWKQDPTYPSSPYEDLGFIEEGKSILKKEEIPNQYKAFKRFFINDENIQKLTNEKEQKTTTIIKRMTSYLWGKPYIPWFLDRKGL